MSAMERVIRVSGQHCGKQAVNAFSLMSRRLAGRLMHQHPGLFGPLEDISGVDVFGIEGRVLAHQQHVQLAERHLAATTQLIPVGLAVGYPQPACSAEWCAVAQAQIALFEVPEFMATALGLDEHGQRAVLGRCDPGDRVHHYAQTLLGHVGAPYLGKIRYAAIAVIAASFCDAVPILACAC
jgi:hypothetical protein